MKVTTHFHLVSPLKTSGAVRLLPQICFHVLDRDDFTLLTLPLAAMKVEIFLWFSSVLLTALKVSHDRFRSFPCQLSVQLLS
jgi:hypothetical protein